MARGGTSAQGTGGKKRKQPGKQVDVVEISSSYEGGDGAAAASDRERADYELALQLQQEDIARALTEATSPPGPAAHSEPTSTHSAKRLKISEAELADPSEGASEKAEAPLTGVERRRDGESVDAYFLRVAQLRAMEVLQGKKIRPASEIDAEVRKRDETAAEAGTVSTASGKGKKGRKSAGSTGKRKSIDGKNNEPYDPYDLPSDEEKIDKEMLVRKEVEHYEDADPMVLMPLLDYQRQFLWWAGVQEKGDMRGGILADEMGMGKTIQAISIICSHRTDDQMQHLTPESLKQAGIEWDPAPFSDLRPKKEEEKEKEEAEEPKGKRKRKPKAPKITAWEVDRPVVEDDGTSGEPCCKTTLVVCPVVAVIQWKQEISRFVQPGALKVVTYHGPKRGGTTKEDLEEADVVLTTYSVLEQDYRKHCMPDKVVCPYCDKKYYPDRIKVHLKFFCGPNAHKTEAQAKTKKKGKSLLMMKHRELKKQKEQQESGGKERSGKAAPFKSGTSTGNTKAKRGASSASKSKSAAVKEEDSDAGEEKSVAIKQDEGARARGKSVVIKEEEGATGGDGGKRQPRGARKQSTGGASKRQKGAGGEGGAVKEEDGGVVGERGRRRSGRSLKEVGDDGEDDDGDSDFKMSEGEEEEEEEGGTGEEGGGDSDVEVVDVGQKEEGADEEYDPENDEVVQQLIQRAQKSVSSGNSILHSIRWRRVVLDEAHSIKDKATNTAQAVFMLKSKYRWALSGTPLQNRVNELYSQIRFLRINPFSYYFCKACPCKCLDYPFRKDWAKCEHCGHGPMQHFCWWNRMVANPIIYQGYQGRGRVALLRLRREVLDRTLLRRTKVQCAEELSLPPRLITVRRERMDTVEQDFYEALYTQSKAQFSAFVGEGTLLNNYAHIFDLLIRLRQAVCHPYLVIHSQTQSPVDVDGELEGTADVPRTPGGGLKEDLCAICHEAYEDPVAAECGHAFCRLCVIEYIESIDERATCPKIGCGRPLTVDFQDAPAEGSPEKVPRAPAPRTPSKARKGIMARVDKANFRTSTKIEVLREEIEEMKAADPSAKCLVFSQFTSFLDIIEHRLVSTGIKVVRLTGSMSLPQRDQVINAFTNDPSVTCFLMSLKAGGVALNLTAASQIFLMDPWWNPAVEQQAQDRIHRLGQYKPIKVTRVVIAGTIEERILKLQEKKQLVFEGTVGQDHAALGKLTAEDLAFLFH